MYQFKVVIQQFIKNSCLSDYGRTMEQIQVHGNLPIPCHIDVQIDGAEATKNTGISIIIILYATS